MNLRVLITISGCGILSPPYLTGCPILFCEISVLEELASFVCFVQSVAFVSLHILCVISFDGVVFCNTCVYLLVSRALT